MTETAEKDPRHQALDRLMRRMGDSHIEHAETDRLLLFDAIEASIAGELSAAPSRETASLKADVDRLIEICNELRNDITNRDQSVAARDIAIAERDAQAVELRTGRDNALTLCDTLTTAHAKRIGLVRACLDSGVLETDALKLEAVRTAIDS